MQQCVTSYQIIQQAKPASVTLELSRLTNDLSRCTTDTRSLYILAFGCDILWCLVWMLGIPYSHLFVLQSWLAWLTQHVTKQQTFKMKLQSSLKRNEKKLNMQNVTKSLQLEEHLYNQTMIYSKYCF